MNTRATSIIIACLTAILLAGCATDTTAHRPSSQPPTSGPTSWVQLTFRWHPSAHLDLTSPEGAIVRAATESWNLYNAGPTRAASEAATYPGHLNALGGPLKEFIDETWISQTTVGTLTYQVMHHTTSGNTTSYILCEDKTRVTYNGGSDRGAGWGITVTIQRAGNTPPRTPNTGTAARPATTMFGTWKVLEDITTEGQYWYNRCNEWAQHNNPTWTPGSQGKTPPQQPPPPAGPSAPNKTRCLDKVRAAIPTLSAFDLAQSALDGMPNNVSKYGGDTALGKLLATTNDTEDGKNIAMALARGCKCARNAEEAIF